MHRHGLPDLSAEQADLDSPDPLDPDVEPAGSSRARRGAHVAPRRVPVSRLALLVAASVAGSVVVAGAASLVPKPPTLLAVAVDQEGADPVVDVVALRRRGPAGSGGGTFYGSWAGEPKIVRPTPVAGLNQARTDNAFEIVQVGLQLKLPRRAYVVAMVTALQESDLKNLANSRVPASLKIPHEGVGQDFDSVGLFQQRPSQGWGTPAQLMDPAQSAAKFYAKLRRVRDWPSLSVGGAAQAVQRSAFPGAYTKHTERAEAIVDALLKQINP